MPAGRHALPTIAMSSIVQRQCSPRKLDRGQCTKRTGAWQGSRDGDCRPSLLLSARDGPCRGGEAFIARTFGALCLTCIHIGFRAGDKHAKPIMRCITKDKWSLQRFGEDQSQPETNVNWRWDTAMIATTYVVSQSSCELVTRYQIDLLDCWEAS